MQGDRGAGLSCGGDVLCVIVYEWSGVEWSGVWGVKWGTGKRKEGRKEGRKGTRKWGIYGSNLAVLDCV